MISNDLESSKVKVSNTNEVSSPAQTLNILCIRPYDKPFSDNCALFIFPLAAMLHVKYKYIFWSFEKL